MKVWQSRYGRTGSSSKTSKEADRLVLETGQAEGAVQQARMRRIYIDHAIEKICRQTVQTEGEDKHN